ncbi:heat-inducible transcriptional repressor HrcA [Dermatobacter hominis]|uniref:heat-inducible transcriptional repressor HrcA n=1 Tax=Dermatobacter hominis TaxID=2884263 RepID=UPI001D12DD1A|nr:heat-inducible transcriptional repressor HrcA [Dermatobacter hominis]UDY35774.1 heat-inducible transcriptional repressor HrcA [Dermatobacter hominis]
MLDDRDLDQRKAAILRAVVQQYIETAQPVGSTTVAARPDVAVSSATVRNEMTVLEREGYLAQPHTSAGRVPTEKGYRFFVDGLGGVDSPSPTSIRAVRDFFASAHGELESMLRETTRLLSSLTHSAAVVVGDAPEVADVRSVQLVDLSPRTVLAVVVLSNGVVLKRTFDPGPEFPDGLSSDDLADAQSLVVQGLVGRGVATLATWTAPPGARGAVVADAAADAVRLAVAEAGQQVFVDGAAHVAGSFETRETVEQVLTILEQHFVVVSLLKELIDGGLTVAIGSETGVETLADCALVVAPYSAGGSPAGAIAVLGPTRMDYAETVSTVSVVSRRLSRMLTEGRPGEG